MVVEIALSKTGKLAGKYAAIVDDIDADLIEINWRVQHGNKTKYANQNKWNGIGYTATYMHRLIMERKLGRKLERRELVDHISGSGLDNRRGNLRLANASQNNANRDGNITSVTKLKGSSWNTALQKYKGSIMFQRKQTHLGYYATPLEAHEAYCRKAVELYGEFANFGEGSPFTPQMFIPARTPIQLPLFALDSESAA